MKVDRICEQCGQSFKTTPYRIKDGRGKYCSLECYKIARIPIGVIGQCEVCGKSITKIMTDLKKSQVRFCSIACSNTGTKNPNKTILKKCEVCGISFKIFISKSKAVNRGRFCSLACKYKGMNKEIIKECEVCGGTFKTYLHAEKFNKGRFCSVKCKDKTMFERIVSEETRNKLSIAKSGSNHHNWQGGISFIPYCPKFNRRLKEQIRERDNRTCQLCDTKENGRKLTCHHIHYDKPNCEPALISLCLSCHAKVGFNRDHYETHFTNNLKERGLL